MASRVSQPAAQNVNLEPRVDVPEPVPLPSLDGPRILGCTLVWIRRHLFPIGPYVRSIQVFDLDKKAFDSRDFQLDTADAGHLLGPRIQPKVCSTANVEIDCKLVGDERLTIDQLGERDVRRVAAVAESHNVLTRRFDFDAFE